MEIRSVSSFSLSLSRSATVDEEDDEDEDDDRNVLRVDKSRSILGFLLFCQENEKIFNQICLSTSLGAAASGGKESKGFVLFCFYSKVEKRVASVVH